MTDGERSESARRGGLYGLWVAVTVALPASYALMQKTQLAIVIAAFLLTVHIACIPIWQMKTRRFLCSTAWAKAQGIKPARLRMFPFRR